MTTKGYLDHDPVARQSAEIAANGNGKESANSPVKFQEDLMNEAVQTFKRELPELLADRYRQWVAYRGHERIEFGGSQVQLYDECISRGYRAEDLLVQCIVAEPDVIELDDFRHR